MCCIFQPTTSREEENNSLARVSFMVAFLFLATRNVTEQKIKSKREKTKQPTMTESELSRAHAQLPATFYDERERERERDSREGEIGQSCGAEALARIPQNNITRKVKLPFVVLFSFSFSSLVDADTNASQMTGLNWAPTGQLLLENDDWHKDNTVTLCIIESCSSPDRTTKRPTQQMKPISRVLLHTNRPLSTFSRVTWKSYFFSPTKTTPIDCYFSLLDFLQDDWTPDGILGSGG